MFEIISWTDSTAICITDKNVLILKKVTLILKGADIYSAAQVGLKDN
jgi:hypothetical protein